MADGFAKNAVGEHRVSTHEGAKWKKDEEEAWPLARWTERALNLACNTETFPFKDNEASRIKANEAKANRNKLKQEKDKKGKEEKGA